MHDSDLPNYAGATESGAFEGVRSGEAHRVSAIDTYSRTTALGTEMMLTVDYNAPHGFADVSPSDLMSSSAF